MNGYNVSPTCFGKCLVSQGLSVPLTLGPPPPRSELDRNKEGNSSKFSGSWMKEGKGQNCGFFFNGITVSGLITASCRLIWLSFKGCPRVKMQKCK